MTMEGEIFPRELTGRESSWLDFLLPAEREGYRELRERLAGLVVLGEGRWGKGDYVLGKPGQEIDRTEGMMPVAAYGEIAARDGVESFTLTLSVHQPNDDGMIEFQIATTGAGEIPATLVEDARWTYSRWMPGEPCPATGGPVRIVKLDDGAELLLAISPMKRVLWLYDAKGMTVTLVPITNFYNELMLLKGIRDPKIALDHKRLFNVLDEFGDDELRGAFARYNMGFRKVDPERLARRTSESREKETLVGKIVNIFRGRS